MVLWVAEMAKRDPEVSRLDWYLKQLVRALDECARMQGSHPEAFLWNARRAAEAIVLARLAFERRPIPKDEGRTLGKLLEQDAVRAMLGKREMCEHMETLRRYGNMGTHVQDDPLTLVAPRIVAGPLEAATTWLFEGIKQEVPGDVKAALERIERGEPSPEDRLRQSRPSRIRVIPRRA